MSGRFLIVGTGRCGTAWAASVLQAHGVQCGHQSIRHQHVLGYGPPFDWGDLQGVASFEAVPALPALRPQVDRVLLLVRSPLAMARSWLGLGAFGEDMEQQWELFSQVLRRFAPRALDEATPLARAVAYWLDWNRLAAPWADEVLPTDALNGRTLGMALGLALPTGAEGDRNERTDVKCYVAPPSWGDLPPHLANDACKQAVQWGVAA